MPARYRGPDRLAFRAIPGAASDSLRPLAIAGIDEEIQYCDHSRGNQRIRPHRP
jgi:hypothetical protein